MKSNREQVIAWVGLSEGGYVNHPDDNGGPTNKGITQRTYNAWLKGQGRARRDVRHITKGEADQIVGEQYLDAVRFDDLPAGLDYSVADFAVHSGPARAAKELQKLVGVAQDGQIGAQTLAMVARLDAEKLITDYNAARLAYCKSLSDWRAFGKGWTARIMGREVGAQTDDIGVIDRSVMLARGRTQIPAPVPHDTPKTSDAQIRSTNVLGKVLEDPLALIPAVGTIVTPLASSNGPLSWALAALILIAGGYVAMRALRREL